MRTVSKRQKLVLAPFFVVASPGPSGLLQQAVGGEAGEVLMLVVRVVGDVTRRRRVTHEIAARGGAEDAEPQTRADSVLGPTKRASAISRNAMTDGIHGSGTAGVHAQFSTDMLDVGRRRPRADEQRRADLPVRHTPDEQS